MTLESEKNDYMGFIIDNFALVFGKSPRDFANNLNSNGNQPSVSFYG